NYSSNTVSVLLNVGSGGYAAGVNYPNLGHVRAVVLQDLNGDSMPDLAAASSLRAANVRLNNGDGIFGAAVSNSISSSTDPSSIVASDLNGDGAADLIVGDPNTTEVFVLLNSGNGTFATPVAYTAGNGPISLALGDLDGDGDTDLAVANSG